MICFPKLEQQSRTARSVLAWMGRAGWLRGLLLGACLAGGDAYVVPTSQHVLQLAARRAASPPPRAPSTTATVSGDDLFDEQMKASRRERLKNQRGVDMVERSLIAAFIACLVYLISTTP